MLITQAELSDLRQFLHEQMHPRTDAEGDPIWDCDHTLKQTRAWLKAHQKPLRENLRAIKERGGYCDCEVLLNVSLARWPAQEEDHDSASTIHS